MDKFKLVSTYKPQGDQPRAIQDLVSGIKRGENYQTLLGVTGSGKTFTMANVIEKINKPTLILSGLLPYNIPLGSSMAAVPPATDVLINFLRVC